MNAKRKTESYVAAEDGGGVTPDEELRTMAKVAALDGKVVARVGTENGIVPMSTLNKPLTDRVLIDTDIEVESETLRREAARIAQGN
jgi:hypothetical protein